MIGSATSNGRISITGIGSRAPERVMTNDELAQMVDTSDEWIIERTGIRERRVAAPDEAMSDLALPASLAALEQAGVKGSDLELIVVATVTPDMLFPSTGAILADRLGAKDAAAYDLSAGCTGFVYAVVQAHAMVASGLADHALVVGGDVLSRVVDWEDRSTCVLFGDGAGAVVLERVSEGGFLGFELGADGSGGPQLYIPAGGSRQPASAESVAARQHFAKMNGREVFKFATPCARRLGREGAARMRRRRRATSTSTCRTRRTCGSSSTRARNWAFRRSGRWSTSTASATLHLDRSRWRSAMPRPTGDWLQVKWC